MKQKEIGVFASTIAAGLEEAIRYTNGEEVPGVRVTEVPDVRKIRVKLGMTQAQFAVAFNIPAGTVKGWEQKRRGVDAPAAALLRVIDKFPDLVKKAQEPIRA